MAELGTAAEVAEDAGRWWGEAGEWDGGAEGGIAGGGRGEAANGGGGDAARMRGQGMGNERTLAGGGRGRWFQFILWVLPTRSSLSNPVGRSADQPLSSSFLFLLRVQTCSFSRQRSPLASLSFFLLADSIVPLVSSRATSLPSFFPPSKKKNFLLSSPPLFILVPRFPNTESVRIESMTIHG